MDWLLEGYWPWWFAGPAFALVTVGVWLIERRLLGVSGSYSAVLEPSQPVLDPAVLEDAMLQATLEEFGPEAVEAFEREMRENPDEVLPSVGPREPMPRSAHVVFLVMLAAGGCLGALTTGDLRFSEDLGALHNLLTGGGAVTIAVLIVGGFLIGFGTRMAGGCTSGHGLSGCSRLQPGSLVSTAAFFATAVAVSFLMEALAQ